jgi:hypothetical protein
MRNELILKVVCGLVVAFVLYRLGVAVTHIDPLYHVSIPALPVLASGTNSPTARATTNAAAKASSTNTTIQSAANKGTNNSVRATNSRPEFSSRADLTNSKVAQGTNGAGRMTNEMANGTNAVAGMTNTLAQSSNGPRANMEMAASPGGAHMPAGMPPAGFPAMPPGAFAGPPGGMRGMGGPGPPLPPEIQARLDKVIDSEILAPVIRPMPMALLGIAGKDVFFRAPNGQTGLIKEGDELGGVKLISIGVNRVLVEEQGQRKELTIFAGMGSESLLTTQKDSPK